MAADFPFGRRAFIGAAGSCLLFANAPLRAATLAEHAAGLAEIEKKLGGRLGVAAVDTGSGARLSYHDDQRFVMCSSFKWLLAALVLAQTDRGQLTLDQQVAYAEADLLAHSPVTAAHVGEGSLPIETLCAAIVEESDNTAANALLRLVGGPAGLTNYLRGLGDPITRLDRMELALNSNLPGDDRDTTTPSAMVTTMGKVLVGDALSAASRERLIGWMKECRTGLARLRAGLPPSWVVGDKTGTGDNGAAVDDAIAWPPKRSPILIACFLSGSRASTDLLDVAHARIGGVVAAALG